KDLNLINEEELAFLWVTDWPLFEYDEEAGRYVSAHHPFTLPKEEDIPLLETDSSKVMAEAYDIVLNGYEIGGGSLRIYKKEVQESMFRALGFTDESAK
ncbi:aspartate--tRNA ligase, partial [Escherichia coli]|nr:aspartate--tRNA ligase [Escherichia coli]